MTKSERKKVKRNTDVEEFGSQAAWGGARRDKAVVRGMFGCKHDVSECYSPPRVVKMTRKRGMRGGVSFDLIVPASDGFIWNFSRKHCRDKALDMIHDQKPLFLLLSPECTPYSNIPNLNMRTREEMFTAGFASNLPRHRWRVADNLCTSTPSWLHHGTTPASTDWHQPFE